MKDFMNFLETSFTAYHAVEHAKRFLTDHGFCALKENGPWDLAVKGKYFVERGGSALIAFTVGDGDGFRIVASHTDSPCLKLKENPVIAAEPFKKLNLETYGGGIWYSFFDRPLRLAGRLVKEKDGALVSENYVSDFSLIIPSLAVHQQREVNEKFAPNPQVDLLPLLGLGEADFPALIGNPVAFDLYLVSAETPFVSGVNGEFISAPRVDDLSSVYASLQALAETENKSGVAMAVCFDNEEIGSRTCAGAGGDFLKRTLSRIRGALGFADECGSDFLISLDNAHSVHPNHPEKCDLTNKAALGGGVVIKGHAERAYTTDALSSAVLKRIFDRAGVKYQTFFNRSDMRSGGTLGAISTGQVSILSADLGLAQLAMHSAVETFAKSDYFELVKGLTAFYQSTIVLDGGTVRIG